MLNYKLERFLFVILWIFLLCLFAMLLPQEEVTPLIQYQYCCGTLTIAFIIRYIYKAICIKILENNIDKYICNSNYSGALKYINKYIVKQPNLKILRYKKIIVCLLSGRICDYNAAKLNLKTNKKKWLNKIRMADNIICFLTKSTVDRSIPYKDNALLERVNYLICSNEELSNEKVIELALKLYDTPFLIYKVISAIILSRCYMKSGDILNQELFQNNALENSPSAEISVLVKNFFDFK